MTDVPILAEAGDLTVSMLSGWTGVAVVLALLVALVVGVALAVTVTVAVRGARSGRPEWEAWLAARSDRPHDRPDEPADPAR